MKFELNHVELQEVKSELKEHDKVCPIKNGFTMPATGGRISYCFTPTGIGPTKIVNCKCGWSKDITDISNR